MVRLPRFVPVLALALTACGDEPATAPGEAVGASQQSGLTLTAAGVAGLTAATPFDSMSVLQALPAGFATERHDSPSGAPAIWALRDGQIVFEVTGNETVTRIDAPSESVAGPGGARPGQTFAEAGADALDCTLGQNDLRDRAVCRGQGVDLVFASQALVGQTALPPADQLADAFLERLVWRAAD